MCVTKPWICCITAGRSRAPWMENQLMYLDCNDVINVQFYLYCFIDPCWDTQWYGCCGGGWTSHATLLPVW